jgi:hypothetical protein
MARVIKARKPVILTLTAEHVKRSMELKGVGNTATCAAAICTYDHAASFAPYHPVVGYTDWTYSRVFIASRLDSHGLPDVCYAYEHDDEIARLNDTRDGQRRLLARIERDGPITIKLHPYRQRSEEGRSGGSRKATGVRSAKKTGANQRLLTAFQTGALPTPPRT